jgi:hydrogenase/urease accessory protein HupE
VSGWTIAKYALALAGIALVLAADRVGLRWLAYPGLGLIVVGFLLRFPQRRAHRTQPPPADDRAS